jgi:nitroreductase
MAEEKPKETAAEPNLLANETLKTIGKLRTIHGNFLDKPIPEEALQTILQASVRAANTTNLQNYSIVVVKDREKMKQVESYSIKGFMVIKNICRKSSSKDQLRLKWYINKKGKKDCFRLLTDCGQTVSHKLRVLSSPTM